MKRSKRSIILILAVIAAVNLLIGTLAWFTDRVESSTEAVSGTLDLQLSAITTSKDKDFKPGEGILIDFTLTNIGNKSADVLETLVLESSVAMSDNTEFELYHAKDVTVVNGQVTEIAAEAQPITTDTNRTVSDNKMRITYKIPEFILNGSGTGAEIEDGVKDSVKVSAYVLVFRNHASNAFQNASVHLYYEAQAKQHRNTTADTWAAVQKSEVTFAGEPIKAVPANP